MSFGYSFGDFLAGANISYRLIRILLESKGASIEYQKVISELGTIQQTFMQIGYMTKNQNLSQATINAASHIILSSMELIGNFLDKTQRYCESLCGKGATNRVTEKLAEGGMDFVQKGGTERINRCATPESKQYWSSTFYSPIVNIMLAFYYFTIY